MMIASDREKLQIGIKQVTRALREGHAEQLLIARDAEKRVIENIITLASEKEVAVTFVDTMKELGRLCQIDVGAAAAVIIKRPL